jgi:hypothetical protein
MDRGHQIETTNTAYFRHDYDSEHADMRRLYEQAKIDQWNAATDIDWARPLEGDGGLIADDLVDIHGTKFKVLGSPVRRPEGRAQPLCHPVAAVDSDARRAWCHAGMQPAG